MQGKHLNHYTIALALLLFVKKNNFGGDTYLAMLKDYFWICAQELIIPSGA